jgi:hypothetical protein
MHHAVSLGHGASNVKNGISRIYASRGIYLCTYQRAITKILGLIGFKASDSVTINGKLDKATGSYREILLFTFLTSERHEL